MNSSRRTKSGVYENISTNRSINQSETSNLYNFYCQEVIYNLNKN